MIADEIPGYKICNFPPTCTYEPKQMGCAQGFIKIGVDVDDLWQTVQPDPFREAQAQQLQAALQICNC